MTWDKLQKPFGLHWWYRLLTGRKWTYPIIKQDGWNIYWKYLKEPIIKDGQRIDLIIPCRLLNILSIMKFILDDIKRFNFRYIIPKLLAIKKQIY
jgi:hypothetical protein